MNIYELLANFDCIFVSKSEFIGFCVWDTFKTFEISVSNFNARFFHYFSPIHIHIVPETFVFHHRSVIFCLSVKSIDSKLKRMYFCKRMMGFEFAKVEFLIILVPFSENAYVHHMSSHSMWIAFGEEVLTRPFPHFIYIFY